MGDGAFFVLRQNRGDEAGGVKGTERICEGVMVGATAVPGQMGEGLQRGGKPQVRIRRPVRQGQPVCCRGLGMGHAVFKARVCEDDRLSEGLFRSKARAHEAGAVAGKAGAVILVKGLRDRVERLFAYQGGWGLCEVDKDLALPFLQPKAIA